MRRSSATDEAFAAVIFWAFAFFGFAASFFFAAILCTHPRDELRRGRKLGGAQAHRLFRRRVIDAVDLEQDAARLDLRHPVFRRALARAHADFGWLLRHQHVREDAEPDAARAPHLARDRAAARLDLARIDALRLQGLEAEGAEIEGRARLGSAVDTALELLAELGALGLKHDALLFLSTVLPARADAR